MISNFRHRKHFSVLFSVLCNISTSSKTNQHWETTEKREIFTSSEARKDYRLLARGAVIEPTDLPKKLEVSILLLAI